MLLASRVVLKIRLYECTSSPTPTASVQGMPERRERMSCPFFLCQDFPPFDVRKFHCSPSSLLHFGHRLEGNTTINRGLSWHWRQQGGSEGGKEAKKSWLLHAANSFFAQGEEKDRGNRVFPAKNGAGKDLQRWPTVKKIFFLRRDVQNKLDSEKTEVEKRSLFIRLGFSRHTNRAAATNCASVASTGPQNC